MRRSGWRWLWVACAVGILSGCHSALDDSPGMIASLDQGSDSSSVHEPELPLRQAAQACIVTAQQLESAGHDSEAAQLYERARGYDPQSPISAGAWPCSTSGRESTPTP